MKLKNIISLSGIYSIIAIFAVIYQLMSYFQTGEAMFPYVLPWTVFMSGLYLVDVLILKKGITVERFLYVNIFVGIIYILLCNLIFSNIYGVLPRIFAALMIGITIGMTEESARAEIRVSQLLLQLEISLVVLGIVLFFEDTKIMPVSFGRMYMIVAVVLDLCALILSRTVVSEDGVKKKESTVKGVFILGGVAASLLGVGVLFVVSCSEAGKPFLESFVRTCLRVFFRVVAWVNHGIVRLINALPGYQSKGGTIWVEPVDVPSPQSQRYEVEFNIQMLLSVVLTIVFIVFLVLVIRYILKKFKALRLNQEMIKTEEEVDIQRKRGSLLQYGKKAVKHLFRKMQLRWKVFRYPNAPETWLVKAEKLGRKYHLSKMPSESPGGYLRRLAQDEKLKESGMTEQLLQQAREMDFYFYGK